MNLAACFSMSRGDCRNARLGTDHPAARTSLSLTTTSSVCRYIGYRACGVDGRQAENLNREKCV